MNTKNRWPLAIFFSVLFHIIIFLVITLFRPAAPAVKKLPAEIFIAEQQPPAAVWTNLNDTSESTQNQADTNHSLLNKTPTKKLTEKKHETTSPLPAAVPKPLSTPQRYAISFPHGNLADKVPIIPPPAVPVKIAGEDFKLPDNWDSTITKLSVTVIYIITADGHVKANIEKSSGNKDFDNAALRTIYTWHFKKMNADFPAPIEQVFTWPISH